MDNAVNRSDRTLFVSSMPRGVTEEKLYDLFMIAGPVEKVIFKASDDGTPQHALVMFKEVASVTYAISCFHGASIYGQQLSLRPLRESSHNTGIVEGGGAANGPHHPSNNLHPPSSNQSRLRIRRLAPPPLLGFGNIQSGQLPRGPVSAGGWLGMVVNEDRSARWSPNPGENLRGHEGFFSPPPSAPMMGASSMDLHSSNRHSSTTAFPFPSHHDIRAEPTQGLNGFVSSELNSAPPQHYWSYSTPNIARVSTTANGITPMVGSNGPSANGVLPISDARGPVDQTSGLSNLNSLYLHRLERDWMETSIKGDLTDLQ